MFIVLLHRALATAFLKIKFPSSTSGDGTIMKVVFDCVAALPTFLQYHNSSKDVALLKQSQGISTDEAANKISECDSPVV
jgi:hypothetical protein